MKSAVKSRRLEARLDSEVDDLIKEAAALVGETRSEFVVSASRQRAATLLTHWDLTFVSGHQIELSLESASEDSRVSTIAEPYQQFQEMLSGVERGEKYRIFSRGRAIAEVSPVNTKTWGALRSALGGNPPDADLGEELAKVREYANSLTLGDPWQEKY